MMRYDPGDAPERTPSVTTARDASRLRGRDASRRPGHRRAVPRDRPARPIQDRLNGAMVDIGIHRAVAYRDIVDAHFDGHPYAGRRGIDKLIRSGLVKEHKAEGPQGGKYAVLTATPAGAALTASLAPQRGYHAQQTAWSGLGRAPDLNHDIAIYRALTDARARIEDGNGAISRVRLDAELRSTVARRSERVRATDGRAAADRERQRVARELGLPVQPDGTVLYPDAQLEVSHGDGREPGRVNIEIATEHYRDSAVAEKASAGFQVYAASAKASRTVSSGLAKAARSLAKAGDSGAGRGGAGGARDPASVEL